MKRLERQRGSIRGGRLKFHAGLAAVVWYLMVPPNAPSGKIDWKAPLLDWTQAQSFDSLIDCEEYVQEALDKISRQGDPKKRDHDRRVYQGARCIVGDDPDLKAKQPGAHGRSD
jgi:hypothetical protein